jgi:DMSO/TMAO reductase YedYZ molybdopterin-dependent catalytic subunit
MLTKLTRREFMAAAGGSIVSIGLPGTYYKLSAEENRKVANELRPDGRVRIPPGQHAVTSLPDMGGFEGPGKVPSWRLRIFGDVENPTTLSFDDLASLERVNITCDVHCVTGWTLLDSKWSGISLKTIMDFVKPKKNAGYVSFHAPEDYSANIPMAEAGKDNLLLADTFFDKPLPLDHGAPMRALVPDLYFWKSVKWIESIKFSATDEPGFYETNGFSNSADPWKEERFE